MQVGIFTDNRTVKSNTNLPYKVLLSFTSIVSTNGAISGISASVNIAAGTATVRAVRVIETCNNSKSSAINNHYPSFLCILYFVYRFHVHPYSDVSVLKYEDPQSMLTFLSVGLVTTIKDDL